MKKDGQRESATANISDWRRVFLTSVADFSLERLIIWSECQWQVLRAQGDVWNSSLGPTNSPKPKDIQFTVRDHRENSKLAACLADLQGLNFHFIIITAYLSNIHIWEAENTVLFFVIGSVLDVPLKAAVQPLLELDRVFKKKKHNTKYLILVSVSQNKSNSFSVTRSANRNKSRDWETELFTDISFSWPEYSSVTRLLCGSALITLFAVNYKLEHRWGRRKWVQLKVK